MLQLEEIIDATGAQIISRGEETFTALSIDSRTIRPGELFLALKGERFDGHDFFAQALKTGGGAIVSRLPGPDAFVDDGGRGRWQGKTVLLVADTLKALHDMARSARTKYRGPVIGVIGSNGKTTTKELIASILGRGMKVLKTSGNLNNAIGMPLCMTGLEENTGAMVLEMGTNRPGDVDELCRIASPDTAVITNIGYEHLEGFGSIEGVRRAELEILPYVKRLIVNADDAFLMEGVRASYSGELVTYGVESADAAVKARNLSISLEGSAFTLCFDGVTVDICSPLPGQFNVLNCLAAAATARSLGSAADQIREGIGSFRGVNMRFVVKRQGSVTFISDVYNANPSSMRSSLAEFARFISAGDQHRSRPYRHAYAVLGDMFELGEQSESEHRRLGEWLSGLPLDLFIGVGARMQAAVSGYSGKAVALASPEEAASELRKCAGSGDIVFIKGSRGMRMERVLTELGVRD
ncbi:MAG TPA: UDP-N-acetylmuramoyl-tripeptide--D-alanyl-D-alanine ligase [Dissulfurispiraceae bacterium]|nr:UDP-N-acetylmuramoyl-tripeptide--D-alanyl-D-alanine ligase [Dissulfurispiraceae bacterium]